jgi:hypothetical protein
MVAQLVDERCDVCNPGSHFLDELRQLAAANVLADDLQPRPVGGFAHALARTPEDACAACHRVAGKLIHQTRLADPGLAGDEQQSPAAGRRLLEPGAQLSHLAVASNEDAPARSRMITNSV